MSEQEPGRTVQAVETSLELVDVLQELGQARVTELANELGMSKGAVHSHLATLEQNEHVVKEGDHYRLGLRYLQLGETVKERFGIYDVVKDELDNLAQETGELAQFATEEHGRAVYIYKARGENAVHTASTPGKREYLHCLSLGKAILAHYPVEQVDQIVDRRGLPRFTENTITSRDELLSELQQIRNRGYAVDDGERIEGLRCVAAPVLSDGSPIGAVSISGPSSRMTGEQLHETYPAQVERAANVIEINARFS